MRDPKPEDVAFIFATWLKGLYHGSEWYSKIDKDTFYSKYHVVLERLLQMSGVKVACLSDDADVILGYIVYSSPRLHWIFVKRAWRKLGIAKSLINYVPGGVTSVSHLTDLGEKLKPKEWLFDPFV